MVSSATLPVLNHTTLTEAAEDTVITYQPQKQQQQQVLSVSQQVRRAPLTQSTIVDAPA